MKHFWEEKTLDEMSNDEWESLCDGCGQCCLHKIQDEDTDEIYITRVACKLLDIHACHCTQYEKRIELVEDCLDLREMSADEYQWLPVTCAYRLLHEGKPLFDWHPLISKKTNSVKRAKMNVTHFAISETTIKDMDDLEDYILKRQS